MSRKKKRDHTLPSWRDLQQGRPRGKATTKAARQRRLLVLLRGAFFLFVLIAIVAGVLGIRYFSKAVEKAPIEEAEPVVKLDFRSNGVLTSNWVSGQLGPLMGKDVREIDVQTVKDLLESHGQVASAMVAVSLPSSLEISLEEREPIMRLRVRDSKGLPQTLLVARDGTLYFGHLYPEDTLRRLPGAAGLRIRKSGEGYAPLSGLEEVAHLLEYTQEALPSVYRHWQVVDLSDWDPEVNFRPSLVRIRSTHIQEIVFATKAIEEQVQRLAGILEHLQRQQMQQPVFIDLSYGGEAVIRYN